MTSDQFQSIVRALLGAAGGMLLGNGTVDASAWQTDSGALLALASLVWSYAHHGMTTDLILGAVRNSLAAVGGYFVAKGYLSSNDEATIAAGLLTLASAGWAHASKQPPGVLPAGVVIPGAPPVSPPGSSPSA